MDFVKTYSAPNMDLDMHGPNQWGIQPIRAKQQFQNGRGTRALEQVWRIGELDAARVGNLFTFSSELEPRSNLNMRTLPEE